MELNNGAGSLPALLDECGCSHICCRRHNAFLDFARVACRYCPRSLSEGARGARWKKVYQLQGVAEWRATHLAKQKATELQAKWARFAIDLHRANHQARWANQRDITLQARRYHALLAKRCRERPGRKQRRQERKALDRSRLGFAAEVSTHDGGARFGPTGSPSHDGSARLESAGASSHDESAGLESAGGSNHGESRLPLQRIIDNLVLADAVLRLAQDREKRKEEKRNFWKRLAQMEKREKSLMKEEVFEDWRELTELEQLKREFEGFFGMRLLQKAMYAWGYCACARSDDDAGTLEGEESGERGGRGDA